MTGTRRALIIATVAQSLVFQSPRSWQVLRSKGYDLVFACGQDEWAPRLSGLGTVVSMPSSRTLSPWQLAQTSFALRRLLRENWDLVQVQSPIAGAIARVLHTRSDRFPLLYVVHGFHFDPGSPRAASLPALTIERLLISRADYVAAVAQADYEWARARLGIDRVTRLPGAGVSVTRFARAGRKPDRGSKSSVMFCGELNSNKDPLYAVDVVREVRARGVDQQLIIIGDGPLRGDIERLAREHEWIEWVRYTDHVEDFLWHADCVVAPSWREGLPRLVIEAFAAGTPVVARANRGTRELLAGLPGLLPRDASVADWATQLEQLRCDPPDPDVLLDRALRYDEELFSCAYGRLIDQLGGLGSSTSGNRR